ncbi:NAD dependent epimerase dehydratase family protein [Grosmannia clavigera kw1407]|uniref:NAD dependent epimerase dehydratase family protein n=1 Tax=Grosmannia clavigera (strain kw1407 / UAMH 11150) TaxID=655863 RepID=F0XGC4_GROCL|nr:NAD dependent epimerase dehydratase family protein [Grosmannia clavigera kw1407]EFX02755.1 NAD dependent epimerase dehydratase family protein [Grosmannia clavigera kw1407]
MAAAPSSAFFGATGLVGGHLLTALLALDGFGLVHTITRRVPVQAASSDAKKLDAIVEPETAKWVDRLQALGNKDEASKSTFPSLVFSALGTTRAQAGGLANQWKIDHDLNVDIARAAKAAGATTFIFVSSAGTRAPLIRNSPYASMKNGVEDTIKELGFAQTIIIHPGIIMGSREKGREHTGGDALAGIVRGFGRWISTGVQDSLGQEADVIARATAHAALLASQGKAPSPHWVLEAKDIVRLGRDEWKF